MKPYRLPDDSHRIVILGKTGTGKTQLGVWHLSQRAYLTRPWLVLDFKHDELINSIDGAVHIDVGEVPKKPGIYVTHPYGSEKGSPEVDALLWKIHQRGNCGIFVDEGFMIGPRSDAFNAILTQGRSKRIPCITLSQRPVWMSRFVFSEADFIQYMFLNDKRDRETVQNFTPFDVEKRLPPYHSFYYDVGRDSTVVWRPVPSGDDILASFDERLGVRRKYI